MCEKNLFRLTTKPLVPLLIACGDNGNKVNILKENYVSQSILVIVKAISLFSTENKFYLCIYV